jgi:hypothetical protein
MAVSSQHHSQHHHVTPHPRAGASSLATKALKSKFPLSAAPWDQGAIRDKPAGPYGRSFLTHPFFFFFYAQPDLSALRPRGKSTIYEKNARRNGLVVFPGSCMTFSKKWGTLGLVLMNTAAMPTPMPAPRCRCVLRYTGRPARQASCPRRHYRYFCSR